jgi:5-deoxy-glucuronate isomerase
MTAAESPLIFRKTNSQLGRHVPVTPANSANRHLSYGRIVLRDGVMAAGFETGANETGLIVLEGEAQIDASGQTCRLSRYDAIYIPHDTRVRVTSDTGADLAEFSAPCRNRHPLQVIPYAAVEKDPALSFVTGAPGQRRQVNIVIGKNVEADRLLLGFTVSDPGNWTSWPPHEHAAMLEEMYVYFDMPAPAFGLQLVYNQTDYPELITAVRDGDAVLMPSGYHPNVSVPGHRISFLWAMAAHREVEDRQFGVVNIQPGFGSGGSGLEASRK